MSGTDRKGNRGSLWRISLHGARWFTYSEMVVLVSKDFCSQQGAHRDSQYLQIYWGTAGKKLDWSANTEILYNKGQTDFTCQEGWGPFTYANHSCIGSNLWSLASSFMLLCCGGSNRTKDEKHLKRLIKQTRMVLDLELEPLITVNRTLRKLHSIIDKNKHPLHCKKWDWS